METRAGKAVSHALKVNGEGGKRVDDAGELVKLALAQL